MAKYRKKPVVIEAWRYMGVGGDLPFTDPVYVTAAYLHEQLHAPVEPPGYWGNEEVGDGTSGYDLLVKTPTGDATLRVGDWIGRQPLGDGWDWWPIAAEQFDATYEPVE